MSEIAKEMGLSYIAVVNWLDRIRGKIKKGTGMHKECKSLVNMLEIMKEYAKPSTDTIIEIQCFGRVEWQKKRSVW